MSHRYRTASTREAEAALELLRSQGYRAQPDTDSDLVLVIEQDTVEAVELLLRRAPAAQRIN